MCWADGDRRLVRMKKTATPMDAATAVLSDPTLPPAPMSDSSASASWDFRSPPVTIWRCGISRRRRSRPGTDPSGIATRTAPNGQRFMIAPTQVWLADGHARLRGVDLGPAGPLDEQAELADFRPPQRGIFVVGSGHFDTYDATRHRAADRTVSIDGSSSDLGA